MRHRRRRLPVSDSTPNKRPLRFTAYGGTAQLSTRRLARLVRELDPELRRLVQRCFPYDWSEPPVLQGILEDVLTMGPPERAGIRRRGYAGVQRLSWQEQLTVIDAYLNRRGLVEIWLLRAGVVDACLTRGLPPPPWPMPALSINAQRQRPPEDVGRGGTALHEAMSCDPWVAHQLLDWGADPNVVDELGQTPLHLAASNDSVDLVSLLVAHRARCTAQDAKGRRPLRVALQAASFFSVVSLLKAGAPVEDVGPYAEALVGFARNLGEPEVAAKLDALVLGQALLPIAATSSRRRL